jgi:hypothetical protein
MILYDLGWNPNKRKRKRKDSDKEAEDEEWVHGAIIAQLRCLIYQLVPVIVVYTL